MSNPKIIDLFSGGGFFGKAFQDEGFTVALAVDIEDGNVAAHKRMFPSIPAMGMDLAAIDGTYLLAAACLNGLLGVGDDIDCLIAAPPGHCFNVENVRMTDQRIKLTFELARFASYLRPKFAVFEGAAAMMKPSNKRILGELIRRMDSAGYNCPPPRVLSAVSYGVPQRRKRVYLLFSRDDMPAISYPQPVGWSMTAKQAIADLLDPSMASGLSGSGYVSHSPEVVERFAAVEPGKRSRGWFTRLRADYPAPTLSPGTSYAAKKAAQRVSGRRGGTNGGKFTPTTPIHYSENRLITVREAARLTGIADDVPLTGPRSGELQRIGQGTPPPVGRAIAREVMAALKLSELCHA